MLNSFGSKIVFHVGSFSCVLLSGSVHFISGITNQNEPGQETGLYPASRSGLAVTALCCCGGRIFWGDDGCAGVAKQHSCQSLMWSSQDPFLGL